MTLADLIAQLPALTVITDPEVMEGYRRDYARMSDAGVPVAVVRPTNTEEVQRVVRWAASSGTPVVPRGTGTGLSGGATAVTGAIVLSTERMRDITVDPNARTAVVQPGALNSEIKKLAGEQGLWYPPDPSSYEICSIGGNVATNAGGLCCVRYGVTADYVLGLRVVLADGRAVRLGGRCLKDSAGLALTKLFVGSEGTLGVITEVTLRLIPLQSPQSTVVASFATVTDACNAVRDITFSMRPSMLEFMDAVAINAVEDHLRMGLDRSAGAMLVARSDAPGRFAVDEAEAIAQVCRSHDAAEVFLTEDPDDGEAFTAARRLAVPALELKGTLLLEDVGVPLSQMADLVNGVARIADQRGVMMSVVAHAGDGNTHPVIVFDPADVAAAERAWLAFGDVMNLAISLGGTITGEHGVGRLKRAWLPDQVGQDVMDVTRRIKFALDPHGMFNPGVIV